MKLSTKILIPLIVMYVIESIACNAKDRLEVVASTTDKTTNSQQFINNLRIYYKINYPNDTTTLNDEYLLNYFPCRKIDEFGSITIASASYSREYDGQVSLAVIISETELQNKTTTFYLSRNPYFAKSLNGEHFYKLEYVDSVLNKLKSLSNVSISERNNIISKIILLSSLENYRISKYGSKLTCIIQQSCLDLIQINDQTIKVFENRLKDRNSINLYYPNESVFQNELLNCCNVDIGLFNYIELIKEVDMRRQADSAMVLSFTNFSKSLILDSAFQYIATNMKDPNKLLFYSVPDFQLYEIDILFSEETGFTTSLKWLYPRVSWDLPYLPKIAPELTGIYEPVLLD